MEENLKKRFAEIVEESSAFFRRPEGITQLEQEVDVAKPSKDRPRNEAGWTQRFTELLDTDKLKSFYHDEPWLMLMALWGLNGGEKQSADAEAMNAIMKTAFQRSDAVAPQFRSITSTCMEVQLPENPLYRNWLKEVLKGLQSRHHPYTDRHRKLIKKIESDSASVEGNTNLDALITGTQTNGAPAAVFIEAKFLSDISKDITYAVARNQIARNIDCALDVMTAGGSDLNAIDSFWFVLLTPGMFRTDKYGGIRTADENYASALQTNRSRLYCYKMDEYLHPDGLFADLPHWKDKLTPDQQQQTCRRIGWMTFEDIVEIVMDGRLLSPADARLYESFFAERAIAFAS